MENKTQQTTELVIQGDEVFSRESFLTPVGGINRLMDEYLSGSTPQFLSLSFPPLLSKWNTEVFFGQLKNELLAFCAVDYFPMKGSHLYQIASGNHIMVPYPPHRYSDQEQRVEFEGTPKWFFPKEWKVFVMIPWMLAENRSTNPYFFALKEDSKGPVMFKLPNIHDSGMICTGPSYRNRDDSEVYSDTRKPLLHIKYLLNSLHEAPINADLQVNDSEFMQWDEDLKQVDLPIEPRHLYSITDSRIVEFTKWYNNYEQ